MSIAKATRIVEVLTVLCKRNPAAFVMTCKIRKQRFWFRIAGQMRESRALMFLEFKEMGEITYYCDENAFHVV